MSNALKTFERQVLVFPFLVVVLACASFLFGGTCAAWQWWTAAAAVVAAPFVRKDRRRAAMGAAGLFAIWEDNPERKLRMHHCSRLWTKGWIATPFGYFVPDDLNARFLHEYDDENANWAKWNKPIAQTRKAFHAWFVTYPKEVWRRLTSWKR